MLRKTGKRVLWFAGGLACVLSLFLAASPASAAFTFDWTSPGVISLDDADIYPPGPVPMNGGQDITKVWWGWAGNVHYFRMDLAQAPNGSAFADKYGIHMDFMSGSGNAGYFGVDTLLLSSFDGSSYTPSMNVWDGAAYAPVPGMVLPFTGFDFQASGTTLEWKIFGDQNIFTWWGVTEKGFNFTDISSQVVTTPIPSAAWLLGSGVVALIGLRRRNVQRYNFS
jgi:hypothetical protein